MSANAYPKEIDAQPSRAPIRVVKHPPSGESSFREAIRHLNGRALVLLAKTAQGANWTEWPAAWKEIFPWWARASAATLNRAADCPMVLLDFNFQRAAWWRRVIELSPLGESRPAKDAILPPEAALPLARELVLEAWSAARSSSRLASLVFGMSPEVTTLIARLPAWDVDRIVVREVSALRVRWDTRPVFWKELFDAANREDDQSLIGVYLHCLELYGGELIASASVPVSKSTDTES